MLEAALQQGSFQRWVNRDQQCPVTLHSSNAIACGEEWLTCLRCEGVKTTADMRGCSCQ